MLNIIFIGAPGVGKGTQSALIEKDMVQNSEKQLNHIWIKEN